MNIHRPAPVPWAVILGVFSAEHDSIVYL